MVRENLKIGRGAVIGMGSVVLHDVAPEETWAGVPARKIGPA
jgi:serine acetyltransferase